MRLLLLAPLMFLCGCAHWGNAASDKDRQIAQGRQTIAELRGRLAQRDAELREKETQVKELRDRLRNFGVF